MNREAVQDPEFLELCLKFPLSPLDDDAAYRAALAILDRIFALDERRTPAQREYFGMLAELASDYETKHGIGN